MPYGKEFLRDHRVLFLSLVLAADIVVALIQPYRPILWLAIIAGIVLFYFIEYITHRFVLHGILKIILPKAYEGHVVHHQLPTELKYMLTPNVYNMPGYIVYWVVGYLGTRSALITAGLIVGTSLAQLYYEWTHFVSHRPIVPRSAWGRWMKKYHLLHHYKNENYWFGVTNPSLDMVMGTNPRRDEVDTVSSALKGETWQR
ncbi:sterol desaturase family protein [Alicyclobacillus shizuokensis]|uniref:sterol desaturase family protein n=1 Tax=Alicyclobacillus shizuokensis TaxID=392014 RepID=UPI0008366F39|nr:sterol desaturase family protein [Alicyclobacillus shizuokensis]MCL6626603.1 sterol desaturase family protein [Alicyclobacillus shizuokensis]